MRKKVKLDKTLLAMLLGARITTDTPQTHHRHISSMNKELASNVSWVNYSTM